MTIPAGRFANRYLYVLFFFAATALPLHAQSQPASVTVVGSLQSELGCSGDWDPSCATTNLLYDTSDGVWQGSFVVPAGSYEYKCALNGTWDENYGANGARSGANISLNLAAGRTVKFYYSHASHWITSNANVPIATAVGDFQSEMGCSGDWQPECLQSWLQDPDGDGTYTYSTSAIPAGAYQAKVAIDESWIENYGDGGAPNGANISFNVPANGVEMLFSYSGATHILTIGPRSGAHDGNISWIDLRHDSRSSVYRAPGGAVTAGTPVRVRLRALRGDLTGAQVRVWNDRTNVETTINMAVAATDSLYDWWQATLTPGVDPTILWYRFVAIDGAATAYYEDDVARDGGTGATVSTSADIRWQITEYDPAFTTPAWAKNGIVYQIFPDRFRDGNPTNDTTPGTFFYNEPGGTIRRSAQTNWNMPVCDPRASAAPCTGKYSDNFYGGDLQGIADKLPYLNSLGVTVLYLNPIFESPSNHKYDTSDYGQIDDNFGDLALFQNLATQAHAYGMKVVLDGVFNHTSSDSKYFDLYHRYPAIGACEDTISSFRTWYFFHPAGAPGSGVCAGDTFYDSWFGYDSLPKLNNAIPATRQLIWDDPNSVSRYWLAQGADGWRLDVAGDIDPGLTNDPANNYWEGFRSAVHAQKPDAWIVGEEWGLATPWTLGNEWDSTMNYQFSSAVLGFWRDETFTDDDHDAGSSAGLLSPLTPSQLDARLHNLEERYPRESFYAMMNLLDSHDTNRALFMLDHNTDQNNPSLYQNPSYDWSDAIVRLKGAVFLQMTLPGAPTIYYGDEVGLVGPVAFSGGKWEDDPYNRQPYPWLDESGTPFYTHLQTSGAQQGLRDYYQLLTSARNAHAALRTGSFDTLLVDDANDVYVYGRKLANSSDAAVAMINRGNNGPKTIAVNVAGYLAEGAELHNVLNSNAAYFVTGGVITVPNVPARSGALLVLASALPAPPAAVATLAVSSVGSTSVNLSWSAASGASHYDVYKSLLSGGGYTLDGTTTTTNYAANGLTVATPYYFVVVSRNATTGLTSANSNEVSATPAFDLGNAANTWFNLLWPPTITHTISATTPTDLIYGQIWISGATEAPGAAGGISVQVGYGPTGTSPGNSWVWSDMTFSSQSGANDEYVGSLLPDQTGNFDYATRFSSDGGTQWWYADLNGPQRDGTLDNPGHLTVSPSSDTTAPAAPQGLIVTSTATNEISVTWAANSDGDLSGYEIFRELIAAPGYTRIGSVASGITTFNDFAVTPGASYHYYVKAFDTSFNRSAASNVVQASAALRYVDITFNVTVPAFTPQSNNIYVSGSLDAFGPWNPGLVALTKVDATHWTSMMQVLDGTAFDFKFTRGTWETVEKEVDGILDITRQWVASYGVTGAQTINAVVANWRDPIVVNYSPAAGATGVATSTTINVGWSQAMQATNDFAVSSSGGAVAGTFAYSSGNRTTTFTPASPLLQGTTYSVLVSGKESVAENVQQVATSWSFTTACNITTPSIAANGDVTFCQGGSVTLTSSSSTGNQWYRNGSPIGGATSNTYIANTTGSYTVKVTADACAATSAPTTVTVNPKPDATISVASPIHSGASSTASVNVSCPNITFAWSILGGTITGGNGTPRVTFTAGGAGTLTLSVTVTNGSGCSDTKSADVNVQLAAFGAPPFLRATASGASAQVEWAAVQFADHYQIYRSTDNSNWALRGTSATLTFADSGLSAAATYFYRVRAIKPDQTVGAFSATDMATTVSFSDDPIGPCPSAIKASHILELRNAINVARASLGLSAATFTDPSLAPGTSIKSVHVTELRSALAPVLAAIGVSPSYTDPTITPGVTTAKAPHINELRDLIR